MRERFQTGFGFYCLILTLKNIWVVEIKRAWKYENDFILLLEKYNAKNYTIKVYPTTV